MSNRASLLAAATTGLLAGLALTQTVAGHWFIAVPCAVGAVVAGLLWRAAQRADEARRIAALFPQFAPRSVSEGCGSNHREADNDR